MPKEASKKIFLTALQTITWTTSNLILLASFLIVLSIFLLPTFYFFQTSTPLFISVAHANEGPHGGYSLTTERCAGCHRPHSASRSKLLKGDGVDTTLGSSTTYDIADFCFSCHKDGSGANNNVYRGIFMGFAGPGDTGTSLDPSTNPWPYEPTNTAAYGTKNAGLNGGGFAYAKPYWGDPVKYSYNGRTKRGVNWDDPEPTHYDHVATDEAPTTSYHNALDDTKTWTVWGSTAAGSTSTQAIGPGMIVTLKCTSCHDQHGSRHYRILRDERSDSRITQLIPGFVPQYTGYGCLRSDCLETEYTGDGGGGHITIQSWETEFVAGGLTKDYTSYSYKGGSGMEDSIIQFCKVCHSQYEFAGPSYSSYDAGDGAGNEPRTRHRMGVGIYNTPGKCRPGRYPGCAAENLNQWLQLPLGFEGDDDLVVQDGTRNGLPLYVASIEAYDMIVCTTCHQAHGSSAQNEESSRIGPTKNTTGSGPGYSNLLRMNNRGVCEDCHGWTPHKEETGEPCQNGGLKSTDCLTTLGPPNG